MSGVTVHYPFHPLAGMRLEMVRATGRTGPVTVRGPDGIDIQVPRWMTEPAAAAVEIAEVATPSVESLCAVLQLLAARGLLNPPTSLPKGGDSEPAFSRRRQGRCS